MSTDSNTFWRWHLLSLDLFHFNSYSNEGIFLSSTAAIYSALPLLYVLFTLATFKGSRSDCRRWIRHTLRLAEIRWMSPASLRWCDVTKQLFIFIFIFIFVTRKKWRFECTLNRILSFVVETRARDICYWNNKHIIPCFDFFFVFFFFE